MCSPEKTRRLGGVKSVGLCHVMSSSATIFFPERESRVSVFKVGGIFVHKGRARCVGRKRTLLREATPCRRRHDPPPQDADVTALAKAIREATEAEVDELARTLLDTGDSSPFGPTEFKVRALAHPIAAKALATHLAQKKRLRRTQCDVPPLRPHRGVPRPPPPYPAQPGGAAPLRTGLLALPPLWPGPVPL